MIRSSRINTKEDEAKREAPVVPRKKAPAKKAPTKANKKTAKS